MPFRKLLVSTLLTAVLVAAAPVPSFAAAAATLPDFTQMVQSEGPAVVNINTTQTVRSAMPDFPEGAENDPFFEFFRRFAPPQQQREFQAKSLGSGFIISSDGYVLTNAHVVARADEIRVTLTDRRQFKAKLIGSDARADVALLKIEASGLPVVKLGSSARLKVGEWVVAIGSPFGFENSVTSGIVSAKGRTLPDEQYVPYIQTDVPINPGNSGGPLFNMAGEVVGINSQIYSRSGGFMGLSFAIPIEEALRVSGQLKSEGRVVRSRIGVLIQELSVDLASAFGLSQPSGALIADVDKTGAAAKAGLKVGDVVLKVNDVPINGSPDLARTISNARPGTTLNLAVWRNQALRQIPVVAEEAKDESQSVKTASRGRAEPGGGHRVNQVGLMVRELPQEQLTSLGVQFGLLVTRTNAAAARSGIVPGDVIVGVGGDPLTSLKQLVNTISAVPKGGVVALQLLRRGVNLFVTITIEGDGKP